MKEGEREESQQQHNNSRDNRFTVSKLNVYENYEKKELRGKSRAACRLQFCTR